MTKKRNENHYITEPRRIFFDLLANYWKHYGLPGVCGYIDALLWIEQRDDWTQSMISKRLRNLLGHESKFAISVPSINRAIKHNVQFGTVIKRGNHKQGYTYHVAEDSTMLTFMFQRFIDQNNDILKKLSDLVQSSEVSTDYDLVQAVQIQILGIQIYNDSLEYGLNFLNNKLRKLDK